LLAFIAIQTQQTVLGLLMLGLLGTLTAFLVFNFPPARIFMGDCGAMFLGFVLGAGSILCANRAGTAAGLALPALAMGIPILDTLFAVLRRLRHRRSPFAPDCRHVHHRLLNMGFTQRQVAVTGYLVTFLAILIGAFMLVTWDLDTFCVFGCGLLVLLSLFRQAEMGSANDPVAGHLYHLTMDAKRHQGSRFFQRSLLLFREARTFSDWWAAVCDAADRMGFARLSLPLTNRDGSIRKLLWRRSQGTQDEQEMIHSLTFVPDSREGPPLQIEDPPAHLTPRPQTA
jgi:hypothetical protein